MARPPFNLSIVHFNSYFQNFDEYINLPHWIDDCIQGGCHVGDSNPSSPTAIFQYLKYTPVINYETVERFVNRKYEVLYGKSLSSRYCYSFMNRLKSTVNSLSYFFYKNGINIEAVTKTNPNNHFVYADGIKINPETGEFYM